jgi:hypothetical protein
MKTKLPTIRLVGILLLFCASCAFAQTNAPMPVPRLQFLDANGNPLAGGCVFTYSAGTSNQLTSYQDSTTATPNTNPVILDGGGFANIWLSSQKYRIQVLSSGGVNCAARWDSLQNARRPKPPSEPGW